MQKTRPANGTGFSTNAALAEFMRTAVCRSAPASWFDLLNQIGAIKIIREINGLRQAAGPNGCNRNDLREAPTLKRKAFQELRCGQPLAAGLLQFADT